ncbi:zinc-dependent metalloprotease [Actinomyces sp. B33]|uniref:zinc-dependent metalloprotease n=1 Tax=Actinomyces sp. B33 TaxID=2942131 RepID=UPI002340D903|nr:zinc-dependent metalloprotease [Actinomyces sp. B33]MDC4233862.1 zinc-dependent metalloprotease [Actinomyces sp. B33]
MTEDHGSSDSTPFDEFLRRMLGEEAGEEAARAMRAQGLDPQSLPPELSDPARMAQAASQFQFLLNTTAGPVNWSMVEDGAKQRAFNSGDPLPSAAEAERARQAMTVADLWLDAVTDFIADPPDRQVWSRVQWVEATLDMWKRVCEPVAANVSRAMGDALASGAGPLGEAESLPGPMAAMIGKTREMLPKLSSMMFAAQIGNALAALSQEAMGSFDVGLPLAPERTCALVVRNVGEFADGLEIPYEEVQQFVAVREAAHRRLFASVPWLTGDLIRAVERYSANIAIDMEAISEAARGVDLSDPASIEGAMSGGVFSTSPTAEQRSALERLETLLALVEGWVEVVTALAVAPYLPHADQLREMMRRRRASGGAAEQVLGRLIGLSMRPRRARGAAEIFSLVADDSGSEGREALWSHPDMVPTTGELDSPESFLVLRRAAHEQDAQIDAALESLLDGTMGWAQGLSPQDDPESEALRRAGAADEGGDSGSGPDRGSSDDDGPSDEGSAPSA